MTPSNIVNTKRAPQRQPTSPVSTPQAARSAAVGKSREGQEAQASHNLHPLTAHGGGSADSGQLLSPSCLSSGWGLKLDRNYVPVAAGALRVPSPGKDNVAEEGQPLALLPSLRMLKSRHQDLNDIEMTRLASVWTQTQKSDLTDFQAATPET